MSNNIIKKKVLDNFTLVPNCIINDKELHNTAKMMFIYVLSKPDNWRINNEDIKINLNIKSSETIAKFWKELINRGWVTRFLRRNNENNFVGGYVYELNNSIKINTEFPVFGKIPNTEKTRIRKNSEYGKNRDYNNTDTLTKSNNNNTDNSINKVINNNTNNFPCFENSKKNDANFDFLNQTEIFDFKNEIEMQNFTPEGAKFQTKKQNSIIAPPDAKNSLKMHLKTETPFFTILKTVWFDFYKEKFNITPTFSGMHGAKLKSIEKKLKQKSEEMQSDWNAEIAEQAFKHYLLVAHEDKWRKNNFELHILDSQFNIIISKITFNNGTKTKVEDILSRWG